MEWRPPPDGIKCAIVMFPNVTAEEKRKRRKSSAMTGHRDDDCGDGYKQERGK